MLLTANASLYIQININLMGCEQSYYSSCDMYKQTRSIQTLIRYEPFCLGRFATGHSTTAT